MAMQNQTGETSNLLRGILIGGVMGLLLAPEKGEELRTKIKNMLNSGMETISDESEKLKDKAADIKDDIVGAKNDMDNNKY